MFSRFSRRGLCFLLALVTLCMCLSPALTQPAEAVAAGVVAGTVAIGATAVVAAMLSGLGVKPGSNSAAWDNLVSQVENHLAGLGYIVDGVINVASFKPTDDPEKLKAAIAQDIVGLTAQWLTDEDIIHDTISSDSSLDSTEFKVLNGNPDTIRRFDFQVALSNSYAHYTVFYDDIDSGFRIYFNYGYYSSSRSHGLQLSNVISNGSSKTSFGYITLPDATESTAYSYLGSAISGPPYATGLDVDVCSVPANFTDIPAAYPSWVSSGVADAGVTYLPIGIYIPGTEAKPLHTEVPDPTDATDPSEDPDKNPDDPSEGAWLWPGLQTMFTELKENADKIGSAVQEKIDSGLERLGDRVQQLQDGILPKIEAFQNAVTQGFIDCQNWLQGLGETISSALDALGTKLSTGIQSCFDTLREFATQTFPSKMADVGQWIQSLPEKIAEAIQKILPEPAVPPGFDDMMLPGLKDFFPFCIPFDMYDMMAALCADPEAPKFTFATSFLGHVYSVEIDLSAWDSVAATVRYMVVAIYIVALAVATRKFIKW